MRKLAFIVLFFAVSAFGQDTLSNLQFAWKTQEGSGTSLTDSSSNANTGTITSGSWTTTGVSPLTNMVVYNGSTTRTDAGAQTGTNFDRTNPFTVSIWFDTSAGSSAQTLAGTLDTASNFKGWEVQVETGAHCTGGTGICLAFFLVDSFPTNSIYVVSPATISTGTVYNVVVTYDGSSTAAGVKFYLNGSLRTGNSVQNDSLSAATTNTKNVRLGMRQDGTTNKFSGNIGPAYVYSRALNATDAGALYTSPYTLANLTPTLWTLTGPSACLTGAACTYTATTDHAYTGTITQSDGGAGGTFTPTSLSYSSEMVKTFTYSNATPGSVTLTGTSSPSLTNGSESITIRAAKNYCIATAGSDAASGECTCTGSACSGTPWQTITKLNTESSTGWFIPGDTIRFNGTDTFSGAPVLSLVGSQSAPIIVESYGTGKATINAGNGDGINLSGTSEFYTIQNLNLQGAGWTGSGSSATAVNLGAGIYAPTTMTTGSGPREVTIQNNIINGFYQAIMFDAQSSSSLKGHIFPRVVGNDLSNNMTGGILFWSNAAYSGGPTNQFNGVYVGRNKMVNIPGDPNSGNGTALHIGSVKTEAWGINFQGITGGTADSNFLKQIAGWGGYNTGLTFGGSGGIQAAASRYIVYSGNEITQQGEVSTSPIDGCAMDIDVNTQNFAIFNNFTYANIGPSIQIGSNGPSPGTGTGIVRHNLAVGDDTGLNGSSQGLIRFWGYASNVTLYNNTWIMPCSVAVGSTPSMVNFEVSSNNNNTFLNNIFKTCNGYAIFGPLSFAGSLRTIQNQYDASGGTLTFVSGTTTLAGWRALGSGYENLNGLVYGQVGASNLLNPAGFSPPSTGFLYNGGLPTVHNFDLTSTSPEVGAGVDPEMFNLVLGQFDFHGSQSRPNAVTDIGASSYPQPSSTGGSGPGPIVIQ